MNNNGFILNLYNDSRTVFSLKEIALLVSETDEDRLKQKINYYVRTMAINNLRQGVYAKPGYSAEELACKIYTPSYISLEYVLQKSGVIFQYSEQINVVSYLSRSIVVDNKQISIRKIKNEILLNTVGINRMSQGVNIATPERAFLDTIYLNKDFYFDNISSLNTAQIRQLLTIYDSKQMNVRVNKILADA